MGRYAYMINAEEYLKAQMTFLCILSIFRIAGLES